MGWFNDQLRKFKNRNNRSATGSYEQTLHPGAGAGAGAGAGRRGFGPLDPDEAWDARVGNEADAYGYYEEQELGGVGRGNTSTEYRGGSYGGNLAPTPGFEEDGRGRTASRSPGQPPLGSRNPFDDDAAASLRGVSPRPIDTHAATPKKHSKEPDSAGSSPTERRSVFRENV